MTYRHEVIAQWAKTLNVSKDDLAEMVLEWEEAEADIRCTVCNGEIEENDHTLLDSEGEPMHADCLLVDEDESEQQPKDWRDDASYWKED